MYFRALMVSVLTLGAGCAAPRSLAHSLTPRLGLSASARATERRVLLDTGERQARVWSGSARATLTFSSRPPRPALPAGLPLVIHSFDPPRGCQSASLCAWERRARDEAWVEIGRLFH